MPLLRLAEQFASITHEFPRFAAVRTGGNELADMAHQRVAAAL